MQTDNRQLVAAESYTKNLPALMKLSNEERAIIEAGLNPSLQALPAVECVISLVEIVGYAHLVAGQAAERQKISIHANETYKRLMGFFPYCTLQEVKTAVSNGMFGEYGTYYGINAISIVGFVREYLKSEERKQARIKFDAARNAKLDVVRRELTESEYKWWILEDYRHFLNGDENLILFSKRKYLVLRRLGYIEFTSKQKWFSWVLRAKNVRADKLLHQKKTKVDRGLRMHLSEIYNQFEATGEMPASEYAQIVLQARKMIYLKFFEIISEFGIKDFFKEVETERYKINNNAS